MKKNIILLIVLGLNLQSLIAKDPGEEADITGKPAQELTPFQNIRNLSKGLFWSSYLISQKIKDKKTQTITQEELEELLAVFLTWDKYFSI